MEKKRYGFFHTIGWIIIGVLVAALFSVVLGALVMVLWNWLMPDIFGFGVITYWQGFGLALLAKLLFGGMGHKGPGETETGKPRHMAPPRYKFGGHMHNRRFDDAYEAWWESEGAQSFEEYMKQKSEPSENE